MDDSASSLAFDASPLLHTARADRLDVLGDLLAGTPCVTTLAVIEEIGRNDETARSRVEATEWVSVVPVDTVDLLTAFYRWGQRMGLTGHHHNLGETTVCAYVDVNGGIAVIDDREARRVAEAHGLAVRGTLRLLADACVTKKCTVAMASAFADALRESGMRLPFDRGGFEAWSRERGLL